MKKLLCLVIPFAIALSLFVNIATAESYIVTGDAVNLRSSPEIVSTNVIKKLYYGEPIDVIHPHEEWLLVQYDDIIGYIHSDYIGKETLGTAAIANANVNFRHGPDTSYKVITTIPRYAVVKVLDSSSNWYHVEFNGVTGYVFSRYLNLNDFENEVLLGAYTTRFTTGSSQSGRIKNIEKGAALINEHLVDPNETFSMLEMIGPITKAGGYYEAPEYQQTPDGTKTVTGYGGGVCQLATTLYQSVCNAQVSGARIGIIEHHHHSKSVYYIEDGKDATISWNAGQDFSFKNNNSYPIRIRTFVKNGTLSCMIYKVIA